jgi:hypothetical protein
MKAGWFDTNALPEQRTIELRERGLFGSRAAEEEFAHAGEKAEVSIRTVRNADPVIEMVRGQL